MATERSEVVHGELTAVDMCEPTNGGRGEPLPPLRNPLLGTGYAHICASPPIFTTHHELAWTRESCRNLSEASNLPRTMIDWRVEGMATLMGGERDTNILLMEPRVRFCNTLYLV